MRTAIQGGFFQDEPFHAYFDERGQFVPSLTQVLKLCGLSDYSGVDSDVMENAARRGTEVHSLAATVNRYGECDPGWISEECQPYFNAYMSFLTDTGFKPDPEWTEKPMIAAIQGMPIGITADCHGIFRKDKAIIELKCTASRQASWSVQTALQECAIYNSNRCGRVRRFALMLAKDGKYRLGDEHTDHETDLAVGIAALRCVWWRLQQGQKVWEKLG